MQTVWDWVTLLGFCGLVTIMLQRSMEPELRDKLWQYLPPSLGFAGANYAGNHDQLIIAVALLIAVVVYVIVILKVRLPS